MRPIQNELCDLIHRKTGVRTSPEDSFDTLQIDSLGMAELTVEIEKAFGIRIGDDIMDVSDIAGLIAISRANRVSRPLRTSEERRNRQDASRPSSPEKTDLGRSYAIPPSHHDQLAAAAATA